MNPRNAGQQKPLRRQRARILRWLTEQRESRGGSPVPKEAANFAERLWVERKKHGRSDL